MKAKIVKINKDSVVIKNDKDKFVEVPKEKLEFKYELGDTIEIERDGDTFYFLPSNNNTINENLEAFWEDEPKKHTPAKNTFKKVGVKGIGGWLMLFIISMCLGLIKGILSMWESVDCTTINGAYNGFCYASMSLVTIENAMASMVFFFQTIAIILTLSKRKDAKNYNIIFLIASTLWIVIDTALAVSIFEQYNVPSSYANNAISSAIANMVANSIWISYFFKSERVKNTLTK